MTSRLQSPTASWPPSLASPVTIPTIIEGVNNFHMSCLVNIVEYFCRKIGPRYLPRVASIELLLYVKIGTSEETIRLTFMIAY
jgi:hypothetical protein